MSERSELLRPIASAWEWQVESACRDLPSETFFHPDGERGPSRKNRIKNAKAICATCPVIKECLQHALTVQEPFGIWGGKSEEERAEILSARKFISDLAS
ncbi:MAG: WhiB family transcriptional regulator [Actinomycetes bacterium]|jgi:WhiB family redox-sensing transcriptional regulator